MHVRPFLGVAAAAAALAFIACDEGPGGPALSSGHDRYEAVAIIQEWPSGEVVDLMAEGATFALALDRSGETFESTFDYQDTHVELDGTFSLVEAAIAFSDDPFLEDQLVTERTFDFIEAADRILLRDVRTGLDLDGDGIPETAEFRVVLVQD